MGISPNYPKDNPEMGHEIWALFGLQACAPKAKGCGLTPQLNYDYFFPFLFSNFLANGNQKEKGI